MENGDVKFGQVDLTDCDREPIRIPGSIQPHGVLIALDAQSLLIVQIAGDTDRLLGRPHAQLLGRPLKASLGAADFRRVQLLIGQDQILPRPFFIIEAAFDDHRVEISAHMSGGLVILELEPPSPRAAMDAIEIVQGMIARTDRVEAFAEHLDRIAGEVQAATGLDRVMVYRFREDDSGHVVAERRSSEAIESFLDLHYPASDIPVQARDLYCNNWIRAIPDVSYRPAVLEPADNPLTGQPLDLSFSALRSVSPIHLEYLHNMGIASSMSLSLVVDGKLWGLIACHHQQPLYLGARLRGALELFAQLASLQIRARQDAARSSARLIAREGQSKLVTLMSTAGLPRLLREQPNLLDLVPAGGVAVLVDGEVTTLGATPPVSEIHALAEWLGATTADGIFATHQLSGQYARAAEFADTGAGLLALSVSRSPRDYVLWFLPELVSTVAWAGDPAKPVIHGPLGDRLTPRKSFAAWSETVRGQSRPWNTVELESAAALRVAILDVVLRQMDQVARERLRERAHQELLMAELDHRVKNTLATIQALVRFSGRQATSLADYVLALESRIGSMAKSHGFLTTSRWKGVALRTLVDDELSNHRSPGDASIESRGPDLDLDPKATTAVAMVLHELATNAVKYGCLSVAGGRLEIEWSRVEDDPEGWLTLVWTESGGPRLSPPTHRGFGRTLLERVFAQDVQGRATLEFRPEGVRCVLEVPYSRVVPREEDPASRPEAWTLRRVTSDLDGLRGLRVLVVEDGVLVAIDLADTLTGSGAEVIGPCNNVVEALAVASAADIDVALLDVDLNGEPVWPVAEILRQRGVPFILATGFTTAALRPSLFNDAATINKPYDNVALLRMLAAVGASRARPVA